MQEKNTQGIPIRYIKGVGPKKALLFNKIGVETVSDLLYYLPRRYEDRTRLVEIKNAVIGEEQGIVGRIVKKNVFRARTGTSIFSMTVEDAEGHIEAVWYNMPFMQKNFEVGKIVVLYGKVELHNKLQIIHPFHEVLGDNGLKGSLEIGRIVPIYSLTQDLSQKYMHKIVDTAIKEDVVFANALVSVIMEHHLTAGFSYMILDNLSFDLAWEHHFKNVLADNGKGDQYSQLGEGTKVTAAADIIGVGLTFYY